ncbi:MAG: arylsulfatase [Rhodothermales bacterium]
MWGLLLLPLALSGWSPASAERPPNVVLILTDDQGCGDVAFTGNPRLATPHLDRLASEGTHLTQFYVAPVCAPTRASLLTGRYHLRTGVRGVIEGREFMVGEEVTLAEVLGAAGYATGLVGKWHLGENYPWVPHAQGFDTFVGFRDGSNPYFDAVLEQNGEPYPTQGYLTDVLTDHAIAFAEQHQAEPFFLYLSYNAPHSPLEVPEAYLRPYRDLPEHTALIYGMMASVDENVGRLLGRLDELGLTENTLILFTSDNGPLYGGGGYEQAERYNCGLRGTKYEVYEGGVRVPLVVRQPGKVPAGKTVDVPAAHIDLLPTVLDYAGVPLPESLALDGRSLRPLLGGDTLASDTASSWPNRTLFMSYAGEQGQRDRESAPAPYPGGMATDGTYKMVNGEELYHLAVDPGETRNLAAEKPEVLRRLDVAYRAFWDEANGERMPYPRVEVGHTEENPARLTAHWARRTGDLQFQFADDPPKYRDIGVHGDWLARWSDGDRATWPLDVQASGVYRIALRVRCSGAGALLRAEAGGEAVDRALSACTPEGRTWQEQDVGVIELSEGAVDLTVTLLEGGVGLGVGEVILERLDDL